MEETKSSNLIKVKKKHRLEQTVLTDDFTHLKTEFAEA